MGNNQHTVNYWFELAMYDMMTAQAMLDAHRLLYVGFLCHQCMEKLLKACYNQSTGKIPPCSHNLAFLMEHSGISGQPPETYLDFLDELECLDTEARYPGDTYSLMSSFSLERCKTILDRTKDMFRWIKEQLTGTTMDEFYPGMPGRPRVPGIQEGSLVTEAEETRKKIQEYAQRIQDMFPVSLVALYHSCGHFEGRGLSDIDVAVVMDQDPGRNYLDIHRELFKARRGIDYRIEPHLFYTRDVEKRHEASLISDILNQGEIIYQRNQG